MSLITTVAIYGSPALVVVGLLTLRHHRRVFAWTRRTRITDDDAKELDDVDNDLKKIRELLCGFAQKPSTIADFTPLLTLRHLIDDYAARPDLLQTPGPLQTELQEVVARFDAYLATALKSPLSGSERELMVAAMEQEQARTRLSTAVSNAQQQVRSLRRP